MLRMRSGVLLALLVFGFFLMPLVSETQQASPTNERWAAVIGVGHQRRLYAVADAEAIYHILIGPMGLKKDHVVFLTDKTERKATLKNIESAFVFLTRAVKENDFVFFFFSGESGAEAGLKYLVLHDTDPSDLHSTALPIGGLPLMFSRIQAERIVGFLDASYSGAAGDRVLTAKKRGPDLRSGGQPEQQERTKRVAFIASSRANEISLESPDLGHGLFTYYLVEGLKGAADTNHDGIVSLRELDEYVRQAVGRKSRAVGGNQHTVMNGEIDSMLPLVKVKR